MTEAASTPKDRIFAECARRGRDALVAGCVALIEGRHADVDDGLVVVLGGEHGRSVLDGYNGGKSGYWPRVWAVRGLLHVWDDAATDAIITATADPAWRVREMAAKVVARHRAGAAMPAVAALRSDEIERVRTAAERAVVTLTTHGD